MQVVSRKFLSLDPITKTVNYKENLIDLTAKEFALLEYLMRRSGSIVSKDDLISHVWSDDDDVLPNTVEVYIGYLRNKIDRPFNTDVIITKRGFGYHIQQ
jgi:DNA-binding response OmpR family regulator